MKEIMKKLMLALIQQKEVTLTLEEIKQLVELVESLENQVYDYKLALDPNSYEEPDGND